MFISFRDGFSKDIQRSTISSWLKQTVIFAYENSDVDTQALQNVKVQDVGAMAASLALKGGVSPDQILGEKPPNQKTKMFDKKEIINNLTAKQILSDLLYYWVLRVELCSIILLNSRFFTSLCFITTNAYMTLFSPTVCLHLPGLFTYLCTPTWSVHKLHTVFF